MNLIPNQTISAATQEDAGSLSLKYLYQSDNNMNKDLTHGKIWVFYSVVI